jgi:hypothetical protein
VIIYRTLVTKRCSRTDESKVCVRESLIKGVLCLCCEVGLEEFWSFWRKRFLVAAT